MIKEVTAWIAAIVVMATILIGVGIAVQGADFFIYQWLAPKREAARRHVFEESKAYNQGLQQELESMRFQYELADPSHRAALRSIILHRVADYDLSRLQPDMQQFVNQLKKEAVQ